MADEKEFERSFEKAVAAYKRVSAEYGLLERDAQAVVDEYEALNERYETVRWIAYLFLSIIIGIGIVFEVADVNLLSRYEYGEIFFGLAIFLYVILFHIFYIIFLKIFRRYNKPKNMTLRDYGDDDLD